LDITTKLKGLAMDIKKWIIELLAELISQYLTPELMEKWERAAKKFAYEKLKEFAADTKWTEIDDTLVEKIGQAWGII
jgi:hypothetical protein